MKKTILSLSAVGILACSSSVALAAVMDQNASAGASAGSTTTQTTAQPAGQSMTQAAAQASSTPTVSNQQLAQEIAALQKEIAQLKQQQTAKAATPSQPTATQQKSTHRTTNLMQSSNTVFGNLVTIGPSVALPTTYDGANLVVNSSTINRDDALLIRAQQQRESFRKHDLEPAYPHLTLSGNVEGQVSGSKGYGSTLRTIENGNTQLSLTNAELDNYIEVDSWAAAMVTFNYNAGTNGHLTNDVSNNRLRVDNAFIVLGDYDDTPFYGTVGQYFVPFGRYSFSTVSTPLIRDVFRVKANAATIGYHPYGKNNTPYARAFIFNGSNSYTAPGPTPGTTITVSRGNAKINQGGADIGYQFKASNGFGGDIGASVVSSVTNSQGMDGNSNSAVIPAAIRQSNIPGVDAHGHITYGPFGLIGEYAQALKRFNRNNLTVNGKGARPLAAMVEGDYGVNIWGGRPLTLALSGNLTRNSVFIGSGPGQLPEYSIMAAARLAVVRDTLFSLEYRHDQFYKPSTTYTYQNISGGASTSNGIGGSNNTIFADIDAYF
ncbi:MAG: LbtU family siderophore porin [Pseudomonadota bacterium]